MYRVLYLFDIMIKSSGNRVMQPFHSFHGHGVGHEILDDSDHIVTSASALERKLQTHRGNIS